MNLEREDIVSICDSEADPSPQFLEQAASITKEMPKTASWHDVMKIIDGWISQLLFVQLSHLGALPEKGVLGEKTTLRKQAGIIDKYDAWWRESLNNLEERGYLRQLKERQIKVVNEGEYDPETVWKKWESTRQSLFENFDNTASLGLCESCLQSLPGILRGEILATDILFPRSSMDKVKNIYSSNTTNDYFNGVLAELVQAYVKQRIDSAPDTRLRVIEIGAGTGGTSAMILPKLRPFAGNIEEYCYTDISKAFLFFAEDQYGPDNPYLSYKLWNIEKPLAEQDIEIGGYDLAIATNVLHATKNIRQTLRNAKAALCRNGLILINEISAKSLILHLTFGLLDGWWLYKDVDLRMSGCPGLYPATWKRIMEEEGFYPVLFPVEAAHPLGQQIILAQSDGIVKQRPVVAQAEAASIKQERKKENKSRSQAEESFKNIKAYIENSVLICLSETLRIDKEEIDIDLPFSEYGVDSILGVGFIDLVNECLSISMNTAIIFDYFSVESLTNHIHDTYKNHIKENKKNTSEHVKQNQNTGVDVPQTISKKSHLQQGERDFLTSFSMKSTEQSTAPEVAIIGMSGQFPKATDVKQFWRNMIGEIDGVDELPSHYLDQVRFYHPEPEAGKTYCKWGGVLENRACFDPSFFKISPKEAKSMNPHQRLILQESWRALEDAGYNPRSLAGSKVAVYVGAEPAGYAHETFTGSSEAIIASRISYYLNLRGPAMVVNTGCSSSAAAIHLACESLRTGESRLALAGGVSATLSQSVMVGLSAIEMLSPTGRCRTFDEAGNGTIISEAVGMVLLKRLEDAVADNDPIYGTICGSGVNQDGASNSITAPNGLAQERLIKDVYERYGINPEDISYIEAHGTGTRLGDPVEANALARAFKHFTNKKGYCAIGSAKSHIGHTAAASGVVGLMKVLLSLKYHKIPKLLNFTKINPLIEFEDSAFYINTVLSEWESRNYKPLMAALNSFGHSGTNVHLVIREYVASPEIRESATIVRENMPFLIPLSAKTEEILKVQAKRLQEHLGHTLSAQSSDQVSGDSPNLGVQRPNLADIAYTLQVGREPMEHRVIFLVQTVNELKEQLKAFCEGREDILNCWKDQVAPKRNRVSLFSLDEDVDEIVIKWIRKLKFEKIATAWVQGLVVDWNLLYKENKPNRISLPTYPFAKERYWTSPATELQVAESCANQPPAESLNALKAPKVEFAHSKLSDKPNNVSLQSLPNDNVLTKKQDDRLRPSEAPMPVGVSAETAITDEPEHDIHFESNFTKESIQEQLKKSLAAALWVETGDVDVDKTFVDMGLDSIIAVEWIREINKQYNIKINVSKIYDYSTIRELSVFLEQEVNKQDVALRPTPLKFTSPVKVEDVLPEEKIDSLEAIGGEIVSPEKSAIQNLSIALKVPKEECADSKLSGKPNNVSLQSLSDDNIITQKQDDRLQSSETPMPASVSAETGIMVGPESDFYHESNFTKESIQEQLKKSLAAALWVETSDVDVDKTFVDMGLDSIIAVEWIREINKQYNIKINVSKIYDYSTVRELSAFLEQEVNKQDVALRPSPLQSTSPAFGIDERPEIIKSANSLIHIADNQEAEPVGRAYHKQLSNYKDLIAIVGMSGRYPGAKDLEQYWNNLVNGINSIREIPASRWDVQQYYDPRPFQSNKIYCKWLGGLDDIEYFDPLFFNISPIEAEGMDPQHRLFLQEGYKAFEDAGYSRHLLNNRKCGVYLGISNNEYGMKMYQNSVEYSSVTGNSFAIAAARIAYYLNLKGPAMPIDTACSSSLVATHLACRALANYEIDMALVGGVSLYLAPESYIGMCAAGMLSPSGQCKTFDNSADGFVPGEGIGALVLKRLKDAEDNHNFIYGVIVGSGINQDGKTNGITAPSVKSQIELEREIYDRFQIDPESIGYVEMHGTGTKLGDPIELEALSTVFKERSSKKNYCAIGSVKTNIGHSSAAAGVASMQKVLLSLKNKKLPPTLNFKNPNEHFDFKNSSFYVNTDLKFWEAFSGAPRRAAISSFSFSGTNAHIVVEEYVPPAEALSVGTTQPARGQIIMLSAKDDERLMAVAGNLHTWLAQHPELSNNDLCSIAFTLQMGREAMEARLGLIVKSVDELQEKLAAFLDGKENIVGLYSGLVKRENVALAVFTGDEDLQKAIDAWISKGKYHKLLDLWVKGLVVDWNKLYRENKPRRISLPTYPFAKERYWVSTTKAPQETDRGVDHQQLHPLVHQNTSSLSEQRFTSTFSGEEFFLKDHRVQGKRILPGAAYLEMARAAITQAVDSHPEAVPMTMQLENIVWNKPLIVADDAQPVHIGLYPEDDGRIAYKVYTPNESNSAEPMVHSQGTAALVQSKNAASLDLGDLKARINQRKLTPSQCYDSFKAIGLEYGEAFRSIEALSIGDNEVLANVSLPACVKETKESYGLHPAVLDAAVQASIGLGDMTDSLAAPQPALPFALERLEILEVCNDSMWAWVRYSEGSSPSDRVQKLDIDLCDDAGIVCVQIKGFSSRILEGEIGEQHRQGAGTDAPVMDLPAGLLHLSPVWSVASISDGRRLPMNASDHVVVIGASKTQSDRIKVLYPQAEVLELKANESHAAMVTRFKAQGAIDHIIWIVPEDDYTSIKALELIDAQKRGVLLIFKAIKALLALDYAGKVLSWTVITWQTQAVCRGEQINPVHAGVHGLVGVLAKEYSHWRIRLVDLAAGTWPIQEILTLPYDEQSNGSAFRDNAWFTQELLPVRKLPEVSSHYKERGVYVVIGGAGGIGHIWSRWMIAHYKARIIWIGRRAEDADIKAKRQALSQIGEAPLYIQADATDHQALERAYRRIKSVYAHIQGVVHSAIVLADKSLALMDEQRFEKALAAKVDVSVSMAQVFEQEPLDFVLFFSSLQSFSKVPGQSNYAAGCTFKDAFANRLAQDWRSAVKIMNWGYWGSVGVVADTGYSERMARLGIGSIEPQEGMEALEALLTSSFRQMALIKTLKPNVLPAVNAKEWLSEYPSVTTTDIDTLGNLLDEDKHMDRAKHTVWKDARQNPQEDGVVYQLLLSHLQALGLLDSQQAGSILAKGYERWLEGSIAFLISRGYLTQNKRHRTVVDPSDGSDTQALWAQWDQCLKDWRKDPFLCVQVDLLDACLRALPAILTGKRQAVEVVFPNSSTALVEGIYKGNPVADFFNERLGETLVAYVRRRLEQDRDVELRILEIGAGTGGTTAGLLEKLKPFETHIKEYGYTDLSKAFLLHAQKHYAKEHPYLKTQIFDIEKPLASQQIEGGYDVVIAANVLHATSDIRWTLRNCKAALRKGGLILVNELSDKSLFAHLTFGLLEGWWLYQDSYLRIPGSPGLYPETWEQVLKAEGFDGTFFPVEKGHALGQQIIAALSNGVVRQRQAMPLPMKIGKPIRIENAPKTTAAKLHSIPAKGLSEERLRDKSRRYLTHLVAQGLGMKSRDLDASTPLESYGLDSILVVQLSERLRTSFDNITSTLFFEVQTIEGLVDHLIKTQKHVLMQIVGVDENPSERKAEGEIPDSDAIISKSKYRVHGARRFRPAYPPEGVINNANGHGVEDIAIIGLSGRYPDARDVDEFWRNLTSGKNCIREIPKARWDWKTYFDKEKGKPGKIYSKWGGFLEEVYTFDPLFFQISPREAELMDPQERLFLEEAYKSIEDAGYTAATLSASGNVGVFVGAMNSTYAPQSSHWSIANRVSYLLNFQGPSLAVDTACSSSLTAIHLAMESLYGGKCECAIAGGVNLILKPVHYQLLSSAMMLSATPECKSFGEHADGFVDGEGVGAVVLKPLKKAVQDKDHIYGVLKASVINHGGKTNGYTVPNPKAQQSAISRALKEAQVDPQAISYIEAHGTGTKLGDPIEIAALSQAFGRYTDKKQYCAIGSAKSNIGHCESAAGIAGLTKVLLQMRYKKLAPSLHSKELNPNIDFAATPFVVNQRLKDWRAPEIDGKRYGRIAGVSSFGAGGSNVHMVVEEYVVPDEPISVGQTQAGVSQMIVLSAKNEERLKAATRNLHAWIAQRPELSDHDLESIAYTLQVGREAMERRLGLIVKSVDALREKLGAFLDGEENIVDLYLGRVKRENEALAMFTADEDLQKAIEAWIDKGKYHKLIDLWVKGLVIDWNKLYAAPKPQRISLPTYPFAKERYWVSSAKERQETDSGANQQQLHPLVHQNTSSLSEQRFTSIFSGEEFFLDDHRVMGKKVLPGVAYLEMARAAITQAMDSPPEGIPVTFQLENIVWTRPLMVDDDGQALNIGLYPEADGRIAYEVYATNESYAAEPIVHGQGTAAWVQNRTTASLDLGDLKARINQRKLTMGQCYDAFKALGLEYGEAFRAIETLSIGDNEVLAKVSLPASVKETKGSYGLHPAVMDAAVQASIGLGDLSDSLAAQRPALPFALERLEVLGSCNEPLWAWVRYSKNGSPSGHVPKLDMDLCDDAGAVYVRMRGMEVKTLEKAEIPTTSKEMPFKHGRREEMRGFNVAQCVAWDLKEQAGLLLKMDHNMLDESYGLIEFGFDSVLLAEFARTLTALYGVEVKPALFLNYSTIEQLGEYLLSEYGDRLEAFYSKEDVPVVSLSTPAPEFNHPRHSVKKPRFARKRWEISPATEPISLKPQERFPELIKLNESVKGRPVFWFHGGLGGVGVYSEVAEKSQRPFYGIEARGYRTKRLPLHGVQAMAAYYIQVLQSLLPDGPYDLGGYSFGGILGYEVARQLQELGHTVDTIIMIDSFDSFPELSYKTLALQNANTLLIRWKATSDSKITVENLIRREELDLTLDDKKILNQLCRLLQERGFKMAEADMMEDINQKVMLQIAYEMKNYPIFPLMDSSAINCYYFRNKNGQFFGELEPYLYCDDAAVELDHKNINASETWKAQLPNFHLFDLKASDHFTLLYDPEASEPIKSHCRALYSGKN